MGKEIGMGEWMDTSDELLYRLDRLPSPGTMAEYEAAANLDVQRRLDDISNRGRAREQAGEAALHVVTAELVVLRTALRSRQGPTEQP